MEMEFDVESRSLITSAHEEEISDTSDLKLVINGNQEQLGAVLLETEDSCDTKSTEISLELNATQIPYNTNLQIPSQSDNHSKESEELRNLKVFEITENNIVVNTTKSENNTTNTNLEDTESTDIPCLQYDWSVASKLLYVATEEYQPTESCENFTKGCQWSPDGTCLLVPSEDFGIRIYELPREFYSEKVPSSFVQANFTSALTIKEGGLIYDTCWYPFMSTWDPTTCCFLSTSKESPAHLWDAITGELRATYRAYNQVDEIEASISIQFVNSASEIWCGFQNVVRTFDTNRPGRQTNDIFFKHSFPNMGGLVSCIRENPYMPGLVALGSYSKCIGLYKDGPICVFATASGVTQVEFSSCGTKLYSGVRRNSEFLCWDLRNPGTVLYSMEGRQSDTNQRITFAITPDHKHIVSGGTDGSITVWELPDSITTDNDEYLNPKYRIRLSKDCINGISLHKHLPVLATSSGQRKCGIENMHRDNSVRLWWAS
ncbi:telomerase Cajal body protein 1 [Harpegnathos saltator]|uniref:WD repeat-containing protein 79 n=1 Tax=Harpegnathos saltator TaxID=610380 RepID=E2BV63_HARSA|nr:telomerase Cajal body protein 1 [Harpegnathos saltator]EFN80355.1 WD repeat-containing protein 79 [Harpegnathos saltator]